MQSWGEKEVRNAHLARTQLLFRMRGVPDTAINLEFEQFNYLPIRQRQSVLPQMPKVQLEVQM